MLQTIRKIFLGITGHRANTVANNVKVWSKWDWSTSGEEWSNSEEWKDSLVQEVLFRYIPDGKVVLEIGPGGGRWTEYLVPRSTRVFLVDVTCGCIELCKERFSGYINIEYFVNDGRNLSFLQNASIDAVWSWDVFVHIRSAEIERYIKEFARILSPGGVAVIHHSKSGISRTGWRSDMTARKMFDFCSSYGLIVERQFEQWLDGRQRIWPGIPPEKSPDTISILRKP